MGFFSSLFSSNADTKESKLHRIKHLNELIENQKLSIEIQKKNMAQYRAIKAASHYQVSGKKNIEHYKKTIASYKAEIARLKG